MCVLRLDPCSDPAAGASDDWYKGVLGSRFSFTTELRDTGRYSTVLHILVQGGPGLSFTTELRDTGRYGTVLHHIPILLSQSIAYVACKKLFAHQIHMRQIQFVAFDVCKHSDFC